MYSYTSAPNSADIIYLPLSSAFDVGNPPWQLVFNSSTPIQSALAWHTLSALNNSYILSFGGDPGPNSPIVLPDNPDSAALLDVGNTNNPVWITESASWANEPMRRIYHSASYVNGKIYIIGGVRADGSDMPFQDHYIFDPSVPSFTVLQATGGPVDIYGHCAVVTSDGLILVMGGYIPSTANYVPFSQIWVLDTTKSSLSWTILEINSTTLPGGRRAFAAVALEGGLVVIHGGADLALEFTYEDGWVLDINAKT